MVGLLAARFISGARFFSFAGVIARVFFSGAGEGLFIDLGGWDALFHPDTPLVQLVPLSLIGMLLVVFLLVLFYIPLWMFLRSLKSLLVQLKHGTSQAIFDREVYTPGAIVAVQLTSRQSSRNPQSQRRVFINYLAAVGAIPPASSNKFKRNYLYTDFQDATVDEMEKGLIFSLPKTIEMKGATHSPSGPDATHYWELLVEEPDSLYWARFLFAVEAPQKRRDTNKIKPSIISLRLWQVLVLCQD